MKMKTTYFIAHGNSKREVIYSIGHAIKKEQKTRDLKNPTTVSELEPRIHENQYHLPFFKIHRSTAVYILT